MAECVPFTNPELEEYPEVGVRGGLPLLCPAGSRLDTGLGVFRSLSARLGSTTLASGMLTGSLLGCTVLSGMLIGKLVMESPGAVGLFSLSALSVLLGVVFP